MPILCICIYRKQNPWLYTRFHDHKNHLLGAVVENIHVWKSPLPNCNGTSFQPEQFHSMEAPTGGKWHLVRANFDQLNELQRKHIWGLCCWINFLTAGWYLVLLFEHIYEKLLNLYSQSDRRDSSKFECLFIIIVVDLL